MIRLIKKEKLAYKYAQIKTELSIKILDGSLKPHQRIPSLNEITEQYQVSKITARRVLNDLVAEGLVYAVRGKGSYVADVSSYPRAEGQVNNQNLGVVFEHASGAFMSEIIKGIDKETFELGVHINLCLSNDSYEREAEILNRLADQGVLNILLFMVIGNDENALNPNLPLYLALQARGIQIFLIDCYLPNVPLPSIVWDNEGGMKSLVEHVRAQGCRNLAYISRVNNSFTMIKRTEGFKEGLLENQLSYDSGRFLRIGKGVGESLPDNSREAVCDLLRRKPKLDAILCSDEEVAAGVFQALEEVPGFGFDKVRVGGFGNPRSIYLQRGYPYILLEQNTYELGRMAAEIILSEANLRSSGDSGVFRKVLPVPLRLL